LSQVHVLMPKYSYQWRVIDIVSDVTEMKEPE
jgi:hypothetical protein